MKITEIKPNKKNPRFIKDEKFKKLVKSIQEFPKMMELRPIVVDNENIILGGNMRYRALQELKYNEIPENWDWSGGLVDFKKLNINQYEAYKRRIEKFN